MTFSSSFAVTIARSWTALSLIVIVTAGCAVDQKKEVAKYRGVLNEGVGNEQAPDFQVGQPLSLREALLLANERNENLGLSGEEYVQALIDKDRAAAAFLPTISLTPTYFIQDPSKSTGINSDPPRPCARIAMAMRTRMLSASIRPAET